jgi:transposase
MGTKVRAFAPLCNRSLEDLVPTDHFSRHLEAKLDLGFVRDLVRDAYKGGGRPSVDPKVFFKLQLVMFFAGTRSERELIKVAADRLSVRWYLGYDLNEALPDHSSFTRIRKRYGLTVFRRCFEAIVEQCREAGLIWGKDLYFDATQVDANASLHSIAPRFAVEAHRGELFTDDVADSAAAVEAESQTVELPVLSSETEREQLAQANEERHDWLARNGRPDRTILNGRHRRRTDFEASTTAPDAALMARKGGGLHLGYHDHYAIDGGKQRIILGVLVTPADVMEHQPFVDLLWRVRFRWKLRPHQATGDTTYATVDTIRALENAGIRAYMPLADWVRTAFYGPSRFTYDPERDEYRCPEGQVLRRRKAKYTEGVVVYRAEAATCTACPVRAACTESSQGRQVHRSLYAEYLNRVRAYHETCSFTTSRSKASQLRGALPHFW